MFKVYQFDGVTEVAHFLNGGVTGGKIPLEGIRGLVGSTITFTSPAAACTFTQGSGPDVDALQFKDIKSQMEAQIAGLKVVLFAQMVIGFILNTPSAAVSLGAASEVARAKLGLPIEGAISGIVVKSPSDAGVPRLALVTGGPDSQYTLYVWE